MIWTTNLPTSQRIKELVGYQSTDFYWIEEGHVYGDGYGRDAKDRTERSMVYVGDCVGCYKQDNPIPNVRLPEYESDNYLEIPMSACVPAFTLSELVPVLKQIEELKELGCPTSAWSEGYGLTPWLYHFHEICELVGTGKVDEAQKYVLELLE